MRLDEIKKSKDKGLFVGCRFDDDSVKRLRKYAKDNKVPSPLAAEDFHITIAYSRKAVPGYRAEGVLDEPFEATPTKLDVFGGDDSPPCLVIRLDCPEATKRHQDLQDRGATYDFPKYHAHVTLSYDIGDFDPDGLPDPKDIGPLTVVEIYAEPLDDDWSDD